MSKVFEALERLAMPDELHIKECKKLGIGLTEDYEVIEKALQRLEAIDNANPSEALECVEEIYDKIRLSQYLGVVESAKLKTNYNTIKQALLKAQELEKVLNEALKLNSEWAEELDYYKDLQESKKYLKWEDLEFTSEDQTIKVRMGDTIYKILYRCCDGIEEVQTLSEDEKLLYLNFIGKYKDNVQFFNDLRLERVEE